MVKSTEQSGFTAVELLITLFITTIFLFAGYQLYSTIISSDGAARARAIAGNLTYKFLPFYKKGASYEAYIKNPCEKVSDSLIAEFSIAGLSNPKVYRAIDCPYANTPSISKVTITVTYNKNPTRKIMDATYVNAQ